MGHFSPTEFFLIQSYAIFRQKLCDFAYEISLNRNCTSAPTFFGRYVILLLEWWKEYKTISSSIRVGQYDFCNLYLWLADSS